MKKYEKPLLRVVLAGIVLTESDIVVGSGNGDPDTAPRRGAGAASGRVSATPVRQGL